jgi:hypothetical protein
VDTCKIEGCGGKRYSGALCSRHYNRLRATGTTDDGPKPRKPFPERFWAKVEVRGPNECWPWTGMSRTYGYGSILISGERGKTTSNRAAWELSVGPIPHGMVVRHNCHNRECCNPSHLMLGTRADNVEDMWAREEGAPKGNARLTESQVLEIRTSAKSRAILASEYGVCRAHVKAIQLRRAWRKIGD